MKIIVVHGDDSHTSYERLRVLVDAASKRGWEIDRIFNKNKNIGETLTFSGLFKKDRFVLIENFNLLNKKDLNLINRRLEVDGITVVIYHPGTISKTALKQIKIIHKVEEYKLPKLIWAYLDSFFPGNLKTSLSTLHKLINNEPVEFVFALLSRHLRDVYWAKVDPGGLNLPSWRLGKLQRQASRFSKVQLEMIIKLFANADVDAKTSKVSLADSLDFISITQLE